MADAFVNKFAYQRIVAGILAWGSVLALPALVVGEPDSGIAANNAKNLARLNCGTSLSLVSAGEPDVRPTAGGSNGPNALLLDDSTLSCEMAKGENTFLVGLPNISNLARFAFINENPDMAGTVQVYVSNYRLSPNDRNWVAVGRRLEFRKERFVNISLAAVEGKYVKILFKVDRAGTIAGFGLYGQRTLAAFADQQRGTKAVAAKIAYTVLEPRSQNNLNFNFANLYARANVVWVSSGQKQLANRMIDDDPTTGFDFAPDDPHPTAVVELAGDQRLRRVSAIYETQRGRLDIYLLNQLPDAGMIDNLKPIVSIPDNAGSGKAAADFDPRGARYVALRWTPAEHSHGTHKFKITEIAAFSDAAPTIFDMQGIPELAQNSMVISLPKEPPTVVPVSP